MTQPMKFDGSYIDFDKNRSVFVANNGEDFLLKFINKENVGQEEIAFLLSPEAAEFVATSIFEQLYQMFPDKE
jgi:hypothetical protein